MPLSPKDSSRLTREICGLAPIVPVLVIHDARHARSLAEASGGVAALKPISAPLPQVTFCPTGGVNPVNAVSYLGLPNVLCAGGSWFAPQELVEAERWDEIETLARNTAQLGCTL